jgi:hypothetical protein
LDIICKKVSVTPNETATIRVPRTQSCFSNTFSKKILNKNPKKGANNKSKAKFVFIIVYPLSFLFINVNEPKFLKIETRIANPSYFGSGNSHRKNTKT